MACLPDADPTIVGTVRGVSLQSVSEPKLSAGHGLSVCDLFTKESLKEGERFKNEREFCWWGAAGESAVVR